MKKDTIIIGTRSSKLALWQADYVAQRLRDQRRRRTVAAAAQRVEGVVGERDERAAGLRQLRRPRMQARASGGEYSKSQAGQSHFWWPAPCCNSGSMAGRRTTFKGLDKFCKKRLAKARPSG